MKEVALELLWREFEKLVERWGSVPMMMISVSKSKEKRQHKSLTNNGCKAEIVITWQSLTRVRWINVWSILYIAEFFINVIHYYWFVSICDMEENDWRSDWNTLTSTGAAYKYLLNESDLFYLHDNLWNRHYYPHFIDEEIKAQKGAQYLR